MQPAKLPSAIPSDNLHETCPNIPQGVHLATLLSDQGKFHTERKQRNELTGKCINSFTSICLLSFSYSLSIEM